VRAIVGRSLASLSEREPIAVLDARLLAAGRTASTNASSIRNAVQARMAGRFNSASILRDRCCAS
jgi:hypothetical protein